MLDWKSAYEAPTSLDGPRMFGPHSQRATKWTFAAIGATIGCIAAVVLLYFRVDTFAPLILAPLGLWLPFCKLMASPIAGRPPEYWFKAAVRFRRNAKPVTVSAPYTAVLEVVRTRNLRLAEEETMGAAAKQMWAFLNGLQYQVKVNIRAWPSSSGIERRWFITVSADTAEILNDRVIAIERGLTRQRLTGKRIDWEPTIPRILARTPDSVTLGSEHVTGYLLAAAPRSTETNWLHPLLDGDLPIDCAVVLDPIDNATEIVDLDDRLVEWQSAQILNVNSGKGEDPDIENKINDARRTRLLLSRRQLRVFRTTIAFIARGPSVQAMQHTASLLTTHLSELVGMPQPVIPMRFEQEYAPIMAEPGTWCPVDYPIRMVTPALARTYLFSNSSLSMPGGTACGTSVGSNRENRLNLFEPFSHVVVLGTTNAGKSFWVKTYLLRLMRENPRTRVLLIQCERDEYSRLVRAMGKHGHVDICRNRADLNDIVYQATGNFKTTVQCQLVDLTKMPKDQRGDALAFVLDVAERDASWFTGNGIIGIDELGIVIDDRTAAAAISAAYRRFRSITPLDPHHHSAHHIHDDDMEPSRRVMIGVSQRPSDLLKHEQGKVLADLAKTRIYLGIESTEMSVVSKQLGLAADEATFIETAEQGTGLLVSGEARVGFHLTPTAEELAVGRT